MSSTALAKPPLLDRIKARARRFLGPWGVFIKGFLKHPVMVGAILPSSGGTVVKMLAPVDWAQTKLFVEYGPGVGTFCQPVLDHLRPDATLLVIDLNADFIDYLRKTIRDSRFIAVHGSAACVNEIIAEFGFQHADYILSGLPFSTLPDNLGPVIAESTARALRPGGAFLVYQYRARARDFMAPFFRKIDTGISLTNIPPCHLFWGWKE
ncbi:methyltransferase [Sphingorhabdus sp. IMCC26285]|jgi:phosphatidylethanolamine/phosphatidyl-N-methylethanolamine N-methyltransferase|uniref:Methyltransferase n=1 Tax=Sphingorhabdus profundilacus TaxID=2509718 RepID=A0A6I4M5Q4_9SPHN|nr:methyltransferase [Sphingorhabdus profundilacus]MVZ97958.1 methyltransferase [Sphingorhabdus profundilacus]